MQLKEYRKNNVKQWKWFISILIVCLGIKSQHFLFVVLHVWMLIKWYAISKNHQHGSKYGMHNYTSLKQSRFLHRFSTFWTRAETKIHRIVLVCLCKNPFCDCMQKYSFNVSQKCTICKNYKLKILCERWRMK